MRAFRIHDHIINDYKNYLNSFIQVKDVCIKEEVDEAFKKGIFLPEPLIQFNPSFQISQSLKELEKEGLVHQDLQRIFGNYNLYHHQIEAIKKGVNDESFIVTSGTGSGKSLTFLATIFNNILKSGIKKGIKAILIYPMNALINSQEEEIKKYEINYLKSFVDKSLWPSSEGKTLDEIIKDLKIHTKERFPITYGKYTGQEDNEKREALKENQPDIILTNYMMLELIMTRKSESWLRSSMSEMLNFLVFDELHTYRGRQGADVSMLVRRIKGLCKKELICIGTSATMATEGTINERKAAVAKVASQIFSYSYTAKNIIGEKLSTCTTETTEIPNNFDLQEAIGINFPIEGNPEQFVSNKLAIWLEQKIALKRNENNDFERAKPLTLSEIVKLLSEDSGENQESCKMALLKLLEWAENLNINGAAQIPRKSFLPFKIHQFISQTGNIYVTLEERDIRKITLQTGRYLRIDNIDKPIYPVVFSRSSGYDFICVKKDFDSGILKPREPDELPERITKEDLKGNKEEGISKRQLTVEDFPDGYILLDSAEEKLWTDEFKDYLPDSWFKKEGIIDNYYEHRIPQKIYFNSDGKFSDINRNNEFPSQGWFIPARLLFDPTSGIVYDQKTNEFTKLMRLGNEGRSTATTITSFSIIKALQTQNVASRNQKLLSFTDNRQDASLQAGHFNDFMMLGRLRSAIYHALKKAPGNTLDVDSISGKVYEHLALKEKDYAREPSPEENDPYPKNIKAIKDYLQLRIFYDLIRGWRYNAPNLEQCGLLNITYSDLDEFCNDEQNFLGDVLMSNLSSNIRQEIFSQILDFYRTSYSLSYYKLTDEKEELEERLKSALDPDKLWSLDQDEKIETPYILFPDSVGQTKRGIYAASIGPRSYLGKYLKRLFKEYGIKEIKGDELKEYIKGLSILLSKKHFLKVEKIKNKNNQELEGYRLRIDKVLWTLGDGIKVKHDEVRTASFKDVEVKPNDFFKKFYQQNFNSFNKTLLGREHTGQLSSGDRIDREEQFRKGEISSLYCSPTMELGIDIADLNIVHMRNVPPSPANYAQRSGRAGRSGQAALVFTYCSNGSPHDRNYFKSAEKMVAGSVVPPKIDLSNEELVKAHLHAFLLMEIGLSELHISVTSILDMEGEALSVKEKILSDIKNHVKSFGGDSAVHYRKTLNSTSEIVNAFWFTDEWLHNQINNFEKRFDQSFDRWRILYKRAKKQVAEARIIIDDPTIAGDNPKKREAKSLERLGHKQIDLLSNNSKASSGSESEFYVYRYLASEGFLPGYNFTRLPVRAFLGYRHLDKGELISRPKFIALKEFGPNNLIYHNGGKFRINRMQITQADVLKNLIKISKKTGYAFLNEEGKTVNNDPITNHELKGENVEIFSNVLELAESDARPQERISSEEEERTSMGFATDCFFSFAKGLNGKKHITIKEGSQELLNVIYDQSARLLQINKKWRRSKDEDFKIGKVSGKWKTQKDEEFPDPNDPTINVKLFATDTADILYIQPVRELQLEENGVATLAFALKRAVERKFQVEESEIGVWIMGEEEHQNILIYEAAEGSLGILSQMIESAEVLNDVFKEAYKLLHFDPITHEDLKPEEPKASYDNLLSYYNQRYHEELDRHSIREALRRLMNCAIDIPIAGKSYEEQYQYLLSNYDLNSGTERPFIDYLFKNGLALPDKAQFNVPKFYISADFVYKTDNGFSLVFCDGSVHDNSIVKEDDSHKRGLLRDAGYDVIGWHYSESIEELMERRKDIFRKVR